MKLAVAIAAVLTTTGVAHAEDPVGLRPQVQGDLGLSVVYAAYEHPIASRVAIEFGAGIFGTYFLPWFDLGQDVKGLGVGARLTWFAKPSGHGLYVAGYARGVGVRGELADETGTGVGFTTGAFIGWALALTSRLDLRLGAGAQYIKFSYEVGDERLSTSTPFVALDIVVGYRL